MRQRTTTESGVPGWFEIDEGLPDVSSPRRPLSWVDTAVQILVDLIGLEPVTEVTSEAIPILEDGRDFLVAGEESELPVWIMEDRALLTQAGVGRVWVLQKPRVIRIEAHLEL